MKRFLFFLLYMTLALRQEDESHVIISILSHPGARHHLSNGHCNHITNRTSH